MRHGMRTLLLLIATCLSLMGQPRLIRVTSGEITGINPLVLAFEDQYFAVDLIFDRLLTMDARGAFVPQILESYRFSADRKEAHLEVRKGLQWQDGHPLDAEDIVFTWKLLRSPRMRAFDNQGVRIPDMERVGTHSIRIRSRFPLVTLEADLYTFFPVPKHLYGEVGDPKKHRFHMNPVGSGPYRVQPGSAPRHLTLLRWEGYRGPHPGTSAGFEISAAPDADPAWNRLPLAERLRQRSPDLYSGTSWLSNMLVRRGAPGLEGYLPLESVQDGFEAAWFNCDPKLSVMADVRLRQALANLIPLDEFTRQRQVRPVQVATSLWHPLSWASDPGTKPLPRPAMASHLLDEAGWPVGPNGWRRNAQGHELVLSLFHGRPMNRDPFLRQFIDAITQAGIRVDTRELTFQELQAAEAAGRGDIWMGAWVNNGPDPTGDRLLYTTEGIPSKTNYMRYSNPEVDRLFEAGSLEGDREARQEIYRRINRIIQRERPLIQLEYVPFYAIASKRLAGLSFSSRGTLYGFIPGMRGWRVD